MSKVVVIGLDGATWDILLPMIEKDTLPNLKQLKEGGSWGVLLSTYPPSTVPAWVSFQTGKDVAEHGCFDFTIPNSSLTDFRIINSRDIQGTTFYELLNIYGKKSILINLPVSYPPKSSDITITCFLTPGEKIVFPQTLIDEIPRLRNYRLLPNSSLNEEGKIEEYVKDIREVERIRFECAQTLFKEKEWDFFFVLFSGTDWVQHEKFEDIINGNLEDASEIKKFYKDIDSYIGWFLLNLSKDTILMVISDHGFKIYKRTFCINTWLAGKSYLKYAEGKRVYVGIHLEGNKLLTKEEEKTKSEIVNRNIFLKHFTHLIKYSAIILSKYPSLLDQLEKNYIKMKRFFPIKFDLDLKFDPKNSMAIGVKWGGIYINNNRDYDGNIKFKKKIIDKISGELKILNDPETGKKIFDDIHISRKKGPKNLPDIICESENYWISDSFSSNILFRNMKTTWHSKEGIFLAFGKSIKNNYRIEKVNIWDIAPIILNIYNLPIPRYIKGKVPMDIYKN